MNQPRIALIEELSEKAHRIGVFAESEGTAGYHISRLAEVIEELLDALKRNEI